DVVVEELVVRGRCAADVDADAVAADHVAGIGAEATHGVARPGNGDTAALTGAQRHGPGPVEADQVAGHEVAGVREPDTADDHVPRRRAGGGSVGGCAVVGEPADRIAA